MCFLHTLLLCILKQKYLLWIQILPTCPDVWFVDDSRICNCTEQCELGCCDLYLSTDSYQPEIDLKGILRERRSTNAGTIFLVLSLLPVPMFFMLSTSPA